MDVRFVFQIVLLLFTLLALPAYLIYSLWRRRKEDNRFHWLLNALYTGAFVFYIFLAGPWDWVSYYVRYAWVAVFLVVLVVSYRSAKVKPFRVTGGQQTWEGVFTLLVFFGFLAFTVKGFFYSDVPVHLAFPLKDGSYYVGQGGNSPLLNYHNRSRAQKYALDVVALNAAGARATGMYPSDPARYVIFGRTVYSPCDGTVTGAVDGLPDLRPPAADKERLAGNHVVVACHGVNVLLAHLQNGSVAVQAGDVVSVGEPLGKIGNSGNTSEPHLHVHAVRASTSGAPDALKGEGVPILFSNQFPVRNSVLVR